MSLIGYLWIGFGIWWAAKPDALRNWFARRAGWKLFCAACALVLYAGWHLWQLVSHVKQTALKDLGFLMILVLAGVLFYAQSLAGKKIRDLHGRIPLGLFATAGWLQIAAGILLVASQRFK